MANIYQKKTDDTAEKVKAAESIKSAELQAKTAEIEELKRQLEEAKLTAAKKEDVSVGELPHRQPIEGH